jgi:hypothetical protein
MMRVDSFSITPRATFRSPDNSRRRHSFRLRQSLTDLRLARPFGASPSSAVRALVRPLPFQNALPTHDLRHDRRKTARLA